MLDLSKEKILVVDDMKTIRLLVTNVLRTLGGHDIHHAEDGQKAWLLLESAANQQFPFSLVISDWNMPVMTGIELLKNCRFHDTYEKIPFIFITAENEIEQIQQALKYRVDGYISKPFTQDKLIAILTKVLTKRT